MFTTAARWLPRPVLVMTAPASVLLALTACSSSGSTPPVATARPVTTPTSASATVSADPVTPTASPTPTPTPTAATATATRSGVAPRAYGTASQVKDLFIELVRKNCGPAYMKDTDKPADPTAASVRRGPTTKEWLVTDKIGEKILINTSTRKVYSRQGPKGTLPGDYSFDCDSKVFLGTWD
jgi:hypothetical protein